MKLDQVTIENFRQYMGSQGPLIFARAKTKNVTLVYGLNGAGKSNLFKAINWCIYGETVLNEEGKKRGEIVNKEALNRATFMTPVLIKVQVSFFHGGEKYLLTRSIECVKETVNTHHYRNEVFVMMKILQSGKAETIKNPLGQMNVILPENVRSYFLFDGEKIDNFSKPSSSEDVRNAIYNVLKLEILQRGKEHLDDIAKEYRKELKQIANVQLQHLLNQFEAKKNQQDSLFKRQEELKKDLESAQARVKEIDALLDGMKESHELQMQREVLELEKNAREQELQNCINGIQKNATSSVSLINEKMFNYAISLLESKRTKGEIPSNIRQQFLQDIVDSKKCICGRTFKAGGQEEEILVKMQTKSVSGFLEEEVISLNGSLRGIQAEAIVNRNQLNDFMLRSVEVRDRIDELDTAISEISQKLKDSRTENVERTEKQREGFLADIEKYFGDIAVNNININQLSEQLKDLEAEIKSAEKNKEIEQDLSNKMAIAQKSSNAINEIYQRFADEMREQIETRTKEIFKSLIWKESQFSDVRLGQDYHLEVIDRWNHAASPELSAGERQVLSLSFITAMAKESGEEAPLVMDTPFGRLSKAHRENITKNLPQLTDQLILFITDEEMNDQMAKNLQSSVGETYHLHFNDKTGCTNIERK